MRRVSKPDFVGCCIVSVSGRVKDVGDGYLKHISALFPKSSDGKKYPFFNNENEGMTVKQAKNYLTYGKLDFSGKDMMTLCVSPRYHFYRYLADTDEGREEVFREVIQSVMKKLLAELRINAKWVASIDLLTEYDPLARVVISKIAYDTETNELKILKRFFPASAWKRAEPQWENTNYIENTFAKECFRRAIMSENADSRVDSLIQLSRQYKVPLPIAYYSFRTINESGNLLTQYESFWEQRKQSQDKI